MVDAGVKTTVNLVPEKPRKKINIAVPIFAAAGVIIVGLIIAIVVVNINNSRSDNNPAVWVANNNDAVTEAQGIVNLYRADEYSLEEAEAKFAEKIAASDSNIYILRMTTSYARFMADYAGDPMAGVAILLDIEAIVGELATSAQVDYYVALRDLLTLSGETELAEFYDDLVIEMMTPEETNDAGLPIDE